MSKKKKSKVSFNSYKVDVTETKRKKEDEDEFYTFLRSVSADSITQEIDQTVKKENENEDVKVSDEETYKDSTDIDEWAGPVEESGGEGVTEGEKQEKTQEEAEEESAQIDEKQDIEIEDDDVKIHVIKSKDIYKEIADNRGEEFVNDFDEPCEDDIAPEDDLTNKSVDDIVDEIDKEMNPEAEEYSYEESTNDADAGHLVDDVAINSVIDDEDVTVTTNKWSKRKLISEKHKGTFETENFIAIPKEYMAEAALPTDEIKRADSISRVMVEHAEEVTYPKSSVRPISDDVIDDGDVQIRRLSFGAKRQKPQDDSVAVNIRDFRNKKKQ